MKKFAVILAGNGVYDGSEIHEAVLTLLAIDKSGASYKAFAPDIKQFLVINHFVKRHTKETRNVFVESSRLVRGELELLSQFRAEDFDALVLPGGYGVAKNLCTFGYDGAKMKVNADVSNAVLAMHKLNKPIGAMCIAPVLLAKLIPNATITIGTDEETEKAVQEMGATNIRTQHGDVVVDKQNNLFTTPCYMLEATIKDIALDTENLIRDMLLAMDTD